MTAGEVVVVGGGIVGTSAAYRLARAGVRTVLVDRADPGFATGAGAGIISPGTTTTMPPAYYPLSFAAVDYYPELLAALAEDGETETGFAVVGQLLVATTDDEHERLTEVARIARERQAAGVRNIDAVTLLTSDEARALHPALGPVAGALHVSGGARLEARTLRQAMRRAALRHGLTVVTGSAELVTAAGGTGRLGAGGAGAGGADSTGAGGDRVTAVAVAGRTITPGTVILATGAWTGEIAARLGFPLPIAPQRGQIMHLTMPGDDTSAWPIISGFHSHYQLTFPPDRVVVGATREHGAGYDYRQTAAGLHEVLSEALRISPGLGEATIAEVRVGFRPASPDNLPTLGLAPGYENVFLAAGHGASGLQLGPVSGAVVADLARGIASPLDLAPYRAERFAADRS